MHSSPLYSTLTNANYLFKRFQFRLNFLIKQINQAITICTIESFNQINRKKSSVLKRKYYWNEGGIELLMCKTKDRFLIWKLSEKEASVIPVTSPWVSKHSHANKSAALWRWLVNKPTFFRFHDAMEQNIPQTNTTTAETSEFLGDNTRFIFVSKWPYALWLTLTEET